jgi:phospholipid transport system transporter-binding protein
MLVLPAELTHEQAAACSRMLAQALLAQGGQQAICDAQALQHFDSSALAVLLECRREAMAHGQAFHVRNMPPRLRDLATLYGVAELLPAAP